MDRIEVTLLQRHALPAQQCPSSPTSRHHDILIDETEEDAFLKSLEEQLQQQSAHLRTRYLVLRAQQVNAIAFRLHEALEPKRDADTHIVQAWTVQPQSNLRIKTSSHIQVLKLSTILREVQCLRVYQESALRTPLEIDIFPSLRSVEVLHTQVSVLQNVHYFCRQLRELHVEHTEMETLSQILQPESITTQRVSWKSLRSLRINCSELTSVDATVNQLDAIHDLDLGWNQIARFDVPIKRIDSLEHLKLCHNKLLAIPPIQSLASLRILDLSVNKITSLCGLETLVSLEAVDVSHNMIEDMKEVELLTQLLNLRRLVLKLNYIARRPDYRREVLFYLGEHIELDGEPWTITEISSMKQSRKLQASSLVQVSDWGKSPVIIHSNDFRSALDPKSTKQQNIVMMYPQLERSGLVKAQFVEIHNAPSIFSTVQNPNRMSITSGSHGSNGLVAIRSGTTSGFDREDEDARDLSKNLGIRTVNDYFRMQSDDHRMIPKTDSLSAIPIVSADSTDDSDSDDSSSKNGRKRSRKYTTSDFMRDFEEEEFLIREGSAVSDLDLHVPGAHRHRRSPENTESVVIRVLLNAREAGKFDLFCDIDGLSATLEIVKGQELIEMLYVNDRETPICIHRPIMSILAIGASLQSNRASIITLKLRCHTADLNGVTYQIDTITTLQRVFTGLLGPFHQSQKNQLVICVCSNCGGISQCSREYLTHGSSLPTTPSATNIADMFLVYSCLLCGSQNVREISLDKLSALFATEGLTLPPVPNHNTTQSFDEYEGFYIEENEVDTTQVLDLHECVLISCYGVREVMLTLESWGDASEVQNEAHHDAIVEAMSVK